MSQYDDRTRVSGVSFGTTQKTNAVDYRKKYNEMMAKISAQPKPKGSVFDGFAASNGVRKAATNIDG